MYVSKIIKAGALLPDTKLLLATWDESTEVAANLARVQRSNLLGKASRSRLEDILAIFRQRYLTDPAQIAALVTLAKGDLPDAALNPILYFQATRADALLHDAVVDLLASRLEQGRADISLDDTLRWVRGQIDAGRTERAWSDETTLRVAQGLLATLRDFGVLAGSLHKRISRPYLPTAAFSFIAFQLSRSEPSGDKLIYHPDWRVFFLSPAVVERLFLTAHQERLLIYHAAGRVVRIDFPAANLEDYARALLARSHRPT